MAGVSFEVLEGKRYHAELLKNIPKAQNRIILAAMVVLWGEKTDAIFAAIDKALDRGVHVHIFVDNFVKLHFDAPQLSSNIRRLQLKKTFAILEELRSKGATISFFGKLGLNPFKGRCHIKITVIDDECYSFGGINFTDKHFANSDYMLHAKNADLGDCLEQLVERIAAHNKSLPNAELPLNKTSTILFDGGQPEHSIIYDRACELATKASRIYYVSQMVPSGRLAAIAKNTSTVFYFNHPESMNVPDAWGQAFDQQRYRMPNSYARTQYIHAKYMLFDMRDGTKALLSGSNNFSWRGVAYGTQEIALYSTDKNLWRQLFTFTKKHIGGPNSS